MLKKTLKRLLNYYCRDEDSFVVKFKYPIYPLSKEYHDYKHKDFSDTGIIIQGPICYRNNFTVETVKYYQSIFPGIRVILSTWKGEEVPNLPNTTILFNEKPNIYGNQNINLQLWSTKLGLYKAREMGLKYVLKTRTDVRIYNIETLNFLKNLLKTYTLKNRDILSGRLISTNTVTISDRPYGISDIVMYGNLNDMLTYWDIELDERDSDVFSNHSVSNQPTQISFSKMRLGEVYMCSKFADKVFGSLDFSLNQSNSLYRDYFIIIDAIEIGMFWYKYDYTNGERFNNQWKSDGIKRLNHIDWFELLNK